MSIPTRDPRWKTGSAAKIANARQLTSILRRVLAYCGSPNPSRARLAGMLHKLADDLLSMEFDTPEALDDYLQEHPGADPANHWVKKHKKHEESEKGEGGEKGEGRLNPSDVSKGLAYKGPLKQPLWAQNMRADKWERADDPDADRKAYDKEVESLVRNNDVAALEKARDEVAENYEKWDPSGKKPNEDFELLHSALHDALTKKKRG